jgi:hypothetical protein
MSEKDRIFSLNMSVREGMRLIGLRTEDVFVGQLIRKMEAVGKWHKNVYLPSMVYGGAEARDGKLKQYGFKTSKDAPVHKGDVVLLFWRAGWGSSSGSRTNPIEFHLGVVREPNPEAFTVRSVKVAEIPHGQEVPIVENVPDSSEVRSSHLIYPRSRVILPLNR